MTNEIVVTGLGVVARDVLSVADFWRLLDQGSLPPDLPPQFDTQVFRARRAYATDPNVTATALRQAIATDRQGVFRPVTDAEIDCAGHGLLAAYQAIRQAKLTPDMLRLAGCAIATTSGGMMDRYTDVLDTGNPNYGDHGLVAPGSAVIVLASVFGLTGPLCSFSCACVSSLGAISYALSRIRTGDAPVMIVGGSDRLREADFAGFNALRAMDRDTCRPFDKTRKGMVIGDGAAILVLENEDHARDRGAKILARCSGMGLTTDSHHITSPNSGGLIRAMQQALENARKQPSTIGYVNCHGTGTPLNDAAEVEALTAVFAGHEPRPIISSTKGTTGHLLGSAGAIEVIATILALHAGKAPIMATSDDPEDIPFTLPVPGHDRTLNSRVAMSNSLGFGGLNGSLILELVDGEAF